MRVGSKGQSSLGSRSAGVFLLAGYAKFPWTELLEIMLSLKANESPLVLWWTLCHVSSGVEAACPQVQCGDFSQFLNVLMQPVLKSEKVCCGVVLRICSVRMQILCGTAMVKRGRRLHTLHLEAS